LLILFIDLTQILATSTDEKLLYEVWANFRDATGAKMREDYIKYFKLGNKAATLNKLPDKGLSTIVKSFLLTERFFLKCRIQNLRRSVDVLMGGGRFEATSGHTDGGVDATL